MSGKLELIRNELKKHLAHALPGPFDECRQRLKLAWLPGARLSDIELYELSECYELSKLNENTPILDSNENCYNVIDASIQGNGTTVNPPPFVQPKRFYGSVKLDALRLRRDTGQIADEVIQHFTSLVGAEVELNIEIQVRIPEGVPDNVVRTVTENCRVL